MAKCWIPCLMICFAAGLQMAGTVNTHWILASHNIASVGNIDAAY
jgi:hypothetical protein